MSKSPNVENVSYSGPNYSLNAPYFKNVLLSISMSLNDQNVHFLDNNRDKKSRFLKKKHHLSKKLKIHELKSSNLPHFELEKNTQQRQKSLKSQKIKSAASESS